MGWGCYKHEMDAGSDAWGAAVRSVCDRKLAEHPRSFGRNLEVCPLCYEDAEKRIAELEAALRLLGVIADAYDDNALDPPARKRWGKNNEHEETRNPQEIILYSGRGGKTLLTLADCLAARAVLEKK